MKATFLCINCRYAAFESPQQHIIHIRTVHILSLLLKQENKAELQNTENSPICWNRDNKKNLSVLDYVKMVKKECQASDKQDWSMWVLTRRLLMLRKLLILFVYRKGWVLQVCLVHLHVNFGSAQWNTLLTYAPLTTRWHIRTPWDF